MMNTYTFIDDSYDDYLAHYGIIGQKWGIRRYQNKDGTLTTKGKARYGNDEQATRQAKEEQYVKEGQKGYKSLAKAASKESNLATKIQAKGELKMEKAKGKMAKAKAEGNMKAYNKAGEKYLKGFAQAERGKYRQKHLDEFARTRRSYSNLDNSVAVVSFLTGLGLPAYLIGSSIAYRASGHYDNEAKAGLAGQKAALAERKRMKLDRK